MLESVLIDVFFQRELVWLSRTKSPIFPKPPFAEAIRPSIGTDSGNPFGASKDCGLLITFP